MARRRFAGFTLDRARHSRQSPRNVQLTSSRQSLSLLGYKLSAWVPELIRHEPLDARPCECEPPKCCLPTCISAVRSALGLVKCVRLEVFSVMKSRSEECREPAELQELLQPSHEPLLAQKGLHATSEYLLQSNPCVWFLLFGDRYLLAGLIGSLC